ncbi:MAG: DUF1688 family protein [Proteobacteria bacterium]|nr:DUF1688 family protein [Pseudomonadota bacterium]
MSNLNDPAEAVAWLRGPPAIRARCAAILEAARADELAHFALRAAHLEAAADYVAQTIRANYPTLDIPTHSRWRHFAVGGRDRWAELAARLGGAGGEEAARVRFDLAVTSVLLDAGAGAAWRYREPESGESYARSEGLAVASFALFAGGALSSDPERPLRADAAGLEAMTEARLAEAFQAGPDNPLVGLAGRAALLRRLAAVPPEEQSTSSITLGELIYGARRMRDRAQELVERIEEIARLHPDGQDMLIQVVTGDYWPLPWYLRNFTRVGYWEEMPEELEAKPGEPEPPFIISAAEDADALREKLQGDYLSSIYSIRPNVLITSHIRMDLWDEFMKTRSSN